MITIFKNLFYLRYLKFYQIFSFLKITKIVGFLLRSNFEYSNNFNFKFEFINYQNFNIVDDNFCLSLEGEKIDIIDNWVGGKSLLSNFNIHYFNFIHKLTYEKFEKVLDNWIYNKSIHQSISDHPYVISKRLINLVIFLQNNQNVEKNRLQKIIFDDYNKLIFNLEFRLGNNHLTTNFIAIYFVINIFGKGKLKLLFNKFFENHITSQILEDGCHIEQTPMYHHLFLQDLILVNEINQNMNKSIVLYIAMDKVNKFNLKLNPGIDECTFINDSNNYQFINSQVLNNFINLKFNINYKNFDIKFIKKKSGFFFYQTENKNYLFFNSNIITKFNPGHIHSGLLTYEVFKNKKKIITNLGVGTYSENNKRFFQKSDISKNTSYLGILSFGIYKSFRIFYYPKIVKYKVFFNNDYYYLSFTYKVGFLKKIFLKKSFLINSSSISKFESSNVNNFKTYLNSIENLNLYKRDKMKLIKYKFIKYINFGIKTNIVRYKFITRDSKSYYKILI